MSPESTKKTSIFESSTVSSRLAPSRKFTLPLLSLTIAAVLGITTTASLSAVVLPSAAQQTATPKIALAEHHRVGKLALRAEIGTAKANQAYSKVLTVAGGSAPYQFSIAEGSLPAGLSLNPTTGSITGTPQVTGQFRFAVVVTDQPAQ